MNHEPTTISFVIPCYRSAETLPGVVAEIDAAMEELARQQSAARPEEGGTDPRDPGGTGGASPALPRYTHEIIMVNDGSGADTWEAIRALCEGHPERRGYDLSRNFGQHAALMAGIRGARGDLIVCLDDDGQTPACEVGRLLAAIEGGADVAYAFYEHKEHSAFRNFGSWVNEKMLEWMLDKPKDLYVSSYFVMRRYVADEVLRYENSYPYLVGLVLRTTKNIVNVPVTHRKREVGSSGYTLGKLLSLWMNGFTAFSVKPLRAGMGVGVLCAAGAILYGIYTIIKKFVNPNVPVGWSALMVAVVFFGGMILIMLGLVGEYVGRTYITASSAPQYVIRESTVRQEKRSQEAERRDRAGSPENAETQTNSTGDDIGFRKEERE